MSSKQPPIRLTRRGEIVASSFWGLCTLAGFITLIAVFSALEGSL